MLNVSKARRMGNLCFFFQAEDGIRYWSVTGVQTCALPIFFQVLPRASSYNYVSMDGGKTWKTIPVANPRNLTQGDDTVYFGSDGTAYHAHLSFVGIRVAKPSRAESGILSEASKDGGLTWDESVPAINHSNSVTPFEDKPGIVV